MSLYANKLLAYANRAGGIGLVPRTYDKAKLREYLARSLSGMLDRVGRAEGGNGLWGHQVEALRAVSERLGDAARLPAGIVVIPTGGGKTEIFQRIVDSTSRILPDGRRVTPNTIVLVPTLNLIEQTAARFVARFPHLSDNVGLIGSDIVRDLSGARGVRPVTVMSYEGFVRSVIAGGITVDDVHLLVMDEAHRALSDLRRDVFAPFVERCATLAFSATPGFSEDRNLFDLFGAGSEIINVPAARLREDGIIAPAVNYVLRVRIEGSMPDDADACLRIKRSAVAQALAGFRREHVDPVTGIRLADKPMLAFMRDKSHSLMASEAFNAGRADGTAPVDVISGYDEADEQARKLAALRGGSLSGLLNTRLLGEGSDIPEVGAVFMSPTASALQVAQIGGRAIRMDPRWDGGDVRQTAFVVNTEIEVNGRLVGRPVPYWKAIDDYSIARPIDLPPVLVGDVEILPEADAEDIAGDEAWGDDVPAEPSDDAVGEPDEGGAGPGAPRPSPVGDGAIGDGAMDYGVVHRETMFLRKRAADLSGRYKGWRDAWGMALHLAPHRNRDAARALLDDLGRRCLEVGGPTVFRRGSLSVSMTVAPQPDGPTVLYADASVQALRMMLDLANAPKGPDWCLRKDIVDGKWVTPDSAGMLDRIEEAFLERRRIGRDGPMTWSRALVRNLKYAQEPVRFVDIPPVHLRMDVRGGPQGGMVCYHRDSLPALRRIIGQAADVPAKTQGWLDRREMAALLGGRSRLTDELFRGLEHEFEALERAGATSAVIERDGCKVLVSRRASSPTSKPVCYAAASFDEFWRILGRKQPAPAKGGRDLNWKGLAARAGLTTRNPYLLSVRAEVMASYEERGVAMLDGEVLNAGLKRNALREEFYWDEGCVGAVREAVRRRKLAPVPPQDDRGTGPAP